MEFRNACFNSDGTIDLEIDDANLGWIPFTASPVDAVALGRQLHARAAPVATPYGASPPVFQRLPRLDFWLAAKEVGVTKQAVLADLDALEDESFKADARIYLEDAEGYRREDPYLNFFAARQGIPSAQLDALWRWAGG